MEASKKATVAGDVHGFGVIHEEFVGRISARRCFRRHEISVGQWEKMTQPDELRWWKARGIVRTYTPLRFGVVQHCRRRWGDGLKIIDCFHVVKAGTQFDEVSRDIDEVAEEVSR